MKTTIPALDQAVWASTVTLWRMMDMERRYRHLTHGEYYADNPHPNQWNEHDPRPKPPSSTFAPTILHRCAT